MSPAEIIDRETLLGRVGEAVGKAPSGVLSLLLVEVGVGRSGDASWESGLADAVLDTVYGEALRALEGSGAVYRSGGTTIAVVLPGAEPLFARVAADELLGRLKTAAQQTLGAAVPPVFAAGVSSIPQDGPDPQSAYRGARAALRAARNRPEGGIVAASEALTSPEPQDVLLGNLPPSRLEGRSDVMASLERRLEATRREAGALVFIRGEPGSGKVALLKEFLDRLPSDVSLLSVRLGPTSPYKPYEAISQAVAQLLEDNMIPPERLVRGLDDEEKQALAVVLPHFESFLPEEPVQCQPSFRRGLFQGFAGLLEQLGPQEILVFGVINGQWMDAASLELISYLIRSRRLRVLLVGTVEDLYLRGSANQPFAVAELIEMAASIPFLHVLRLARLGAQDAHAVVEDVLPGAEKAGLVRLIERASAGIPLGIVSVARVVAPHLKWHEGNIPHLATQPDLPRTLNGQVEASLEMLDVPARRLMGTLAVASKPSDAEELAGIIQRAPAEVFDVLETLSEDAFLRIERGRYWFTAEHYYGVAEKLLGASARRMHLERAENAEKGTSDLAFAASTDAASAYALLHHQAFAHYHRFKGGDAAGAERLRSGIRQSSRLIYSPGEADEYMGGGSAQPPKPQRATFEEAAMKVLAGFLDMSVEVLAYVQHGSHAPWEMPLKEELTAAMLEFFSVNENLTLSFREGIPRACGQPLSARRYGDAPSLLAQFTRARGVAVVVIDFRTKIDEWSWFLVGLGHEPNRITQPADWPYFLRDKGVRFVSIEPANGFSGSPPVLAHPQGSGTTGTTTEIRVTGPVRRRRSGQARTALFETSLDSGAGTQTQSAEVATVLAEAGLPSGVSAIPPDSQSVDAALKAAETLIAQAYPGDAASLIERLVSGLETADTGGRITFSAALPRLLQVLKRLPDRSLYEGVTRVLVRFVEQEPDSAVLAAALLGLTGLVHFLLESGHPDLARPLLLALIRKGVPVRKRFSEEIAHSDLLELTAADLSSEDPLRQASVMPVAELLGQLVPTRFINIILTSTSYRVRKAAAAALVLLEKQEREALVASSLTAADEEARARLVEVLDTFGKVDLAEVEALLFDPAGSVRSAAASLAARLDDEHAEQLLERTEKNRGMETALRAAVLISSGGSTAMVLKTVVQNDIRLQTAAAGALGLLTRRGVIPPRKALEALEALLKKANRVFADDPGRASALASAAIKALSLNPLPEAQEAIRSAVDFLNPEIAREAREILGEEEAPE